VKVTKNELNFCKKALNRDESYMIYKGIRKTEFCVELIEVLH
jgi:hypothetical protein